MINTKKQRVSWGPAWSAVETTFDKAL